MGVGVERGRGILKGLAFECLEYAKIAVHAAQGYSVQAKLLSAKPEFFKLDRGLQWCLSYLSKRASPLQTRMTRTSFELEWAITGTPGTYPLLKIDSHHL